MPFPAAMRPTYRSTGAPSGMPSAARSAGAASNGSGKPFPRTWMRSRGTMPDAATSSRSMPDDDHDRGCTRGDAAVERGVERPLQRHLPQPRPEHAQRLEDVRDPAQARPRGRGRRHRVAEAEDVHDVGPRAAVELERQRRRDPHPAVVRGRREVVDAHAVAFLRPRVPGAGPVDRGRGSSSAPRPDGRARRGASSARAPTTTGPPNAVAGHHAGAAKRMRSRSLHGLTLALAPWRRSRTNRACSSSTSTTGRESRRRRSSSPTSARRSRTSTRSACSPVSCTDTTTSPSGSFATASRSCASARRPSSARGSACAGSTTSPTSGARSSRRCAARAPTSCCA